ncbi:uncharacterized protein [Amphiura filiformis]|uniref:uncharacterized protein n=1 Tax=Amphiura filiformis TaxID=82378 RepID=UPI003B22096A
MKINEQRRIIFVQVLSMQQVQIIKEPYAAARFCGPEKASFADDAEFHQNLNASTSSPSQPNGNIYDDTICTYSWVKETLEANYSGKNFVICHDQAYCLGGRYEDLPRGYRHTFLIRHPHKLLPSWKKQLLKLMPSYSHRPFGDLPMLPAKYGYGELYDLMEALRLSGDEENPVIIDADDLQKNPQSILRQYLHLLGIPFSQSLLEWDSGDEVMKSWIMSKRFYEDVTSSGWFSVALESRTFGPPYDLPIRDQLDADILPLVEASKPYYSKMHSLRIKP